MYMKEVFIVKMEDLRFNLTENMKNIFIEIITIRQMLKEDKLSKKEKKLFEKELKELTTLFILEFRENNVEQIKQYNELLSK